MKKIITSKSTTTPAASGIVSQMRLSKVLEKSGLAFAIKSLPGLFLLATLAAVCLPAPVDAGEQVPFKGTFDPVIVATTPLDLTHVRFDVEVGVLATHLGNAQGPGFFVLDLTDFTYAGQVTWAAANGDEVFLTFAGQFIPTATPGLFDNVETFEVVGGTGRFDGATGAGTAAGQFDSITLSAPAPIPFQGTISSPGSLK
jgi:hypothetical protein